MAKKKTTAAWGWVKSTTNTPEKPSEQEKSVVMTLFEPYVQQLQRALPPLEKPQRFNQAVDVEARWRGSHFTLIAIYKVAPGPYTIRDSFEEGFARLTYKSPGVYDLAYFRHTGKWFTVLYDLSLNDCFERVKSDPIFAV